MSDPDVSLDIAEGKHLISEERRAARRSRYYYKLVVHLYVKYHFKCSLTYKLAGPTEI